jgi:hypothetical protein
VKIIFAMPKSEFILPVFVLPWCLAHGIVRAADNTGPPDKSAFNLFNPVPADLMRELAPDRPDKTDSPFTVDAGHFQAEMDFANYTWDSPNPKGVKTEGYQVAPANLKLGVLNNVDLQLVLQPWQSWRVADRNAGTVEYHSGFGDLTPRLKVNLVGNDGGFFALALIPFVKVPSAQNHLGNGAVEGGLGVPYAFDVPHWDVGFQTTFSVNHNDAGNGYHSEFGNSVSIGHAVIGPLAYHVEFFGGVSTEQNSDWTGTFDTWFTYRMNQNLVLDGGVDIGVTRAAEDWHPWMGMTWRY